MNNLHVHEVLRMLLRLNKAYKDKEELTKDIIDTFGEDARFYACSGADMTANEVFNFLARRRKIGFNKHQQIIVDPNLQMCNDEHKHDHHHDHDHNHGHHHSHHHHKEDEQN